MLLLYVLFLMEIGTPKQQLNPKSATFYICTLRLIFPLHRGNFQWESRI